MKRIILFLFMAVMAAFAQDQTPQFQAFSGELMKISDQIKGGYHRFALQVKGEGWAFEAQGEVKAPAGDPYVLIDGILDGEVYVMVAYIPAMAAGTNGKDYQVGMIDAMVYLEDEAVETRKVKFKLVAPANDEWAVGMARDAAEIGAPFLPTLWNGSRDVEIVRAAAVPLDKEGLNPKPKPKPVVKKETPAAAPAAAPAAKTTADTTVTKKRVVRKVKKANTEEAAPADTTPKKKVVKRVVRKKKTVVEEAPEEDPDAGLTIREKRQKALREKRQKAAQLSDTEE